MTAVRDPRRAASARALRASGNFWSRSYSSAGAEAGGAGGGARGRMCAAEGVARRLRASHTLYRVHSRFPPLPENCRCIVRPLDVALAAASDRAQHAGRARNDRCETRTEWRPARAPSALAPRPAERHFRGGCAAAVRRNRTRAFRGVRLTTVPLGDLSNTRAPPILQPVQSAHPAIAWTPTSEVEARACL